MLYLSRAGFMMFLPISLDIFLIISLLLFGIDSERSHICRKTRLLGGFFFLCYNVCMKKLLVDLDIFKSQCLFIWDCTHEEMFKHLERKYKIIHEDTSFLDSADGCAMTFDGAEPYRCVWLCSLKNTPEDNARLAHETVHMMIRLLEHKGIPYDSDRNADETLAYGVDYFMRKVLEYNKKKR